MLPSQLMLEVPLILFRRRVFSGVQEILRNGFEDEKHSFCSFCSLAYRRHAKNLIAIPAFNLHPCHTAN